MKTFLIAEILGEAIDGHKQRSENQEKANRIREQPQKETSIDIENPEEFRNDDDGAPQGSDPSWRRKFSEEQTMNLEEIYARQKYTTGKERAEIAKELSLTTKQVKTWFQNRRTKMKRETKRFQFVPVFVPIEQNRIAIPPS